MQDPKYLSWIALVISAIIFSYGINLPFAGQHDWNSVMYANMARNHLRYGILQTKFGMVTNFGPKSQGEPFAYFTHYPPLLPLLITLSFAVFGIHEWSARIVPILASAILVFFLVKICQKLWDNLTAILCAVIATVSPMLLYYSKIPVHETVVMGFLGFTIYSYVCWLNSNRLRYLYLTLFGLILSQLTSWSGFYLSFYLSLHYWWKTQRISPPAIYFFLPAPIIFTLHLLHMYFLVGPKLISDLSNIFLFRYNIGSAAQTYHLTMIEFITRQAGWVALYFTRLGALLTLAWCIFALVSTARRRLQTRNSIVIMLGLFGFTHNLIFRNLAFIHDYMLIYALPFFSISGAIVLSHLFRLLKQYRPVAIAALIMVLGLIATERLIYLQSLFTKGTHNPGVPLGKALAIYTQPNDRILVASSKFMYYYDVFVRYYADRNVSAADTFSPDGLKSVDYIVIPKSSNTLSPKDKQYLYSNYSFVESGGGIIFKL